MKDEESLSESKMEEQSNTSSCITDPDMMNDASGMDEEVEIIKAKPSSTSWKIDEGIPSEFSCKECGRKFNSEQYLEAHGIKEHDWHPFICVNW